MPDPMESINNAALALQSVAERMEDFVNDANQQVGAVADRFVGASSSVYVDQAMGDNDNPGTREAPVQTLQRAIDLSPVGVINRIYVRGPYTTTRRYSGAGRNLNINAVNGDWSEVDGAVNPSTMHITFDRYERSDGQRYIELHGFSLSWNGIVNINGFRVVLPSMEQVTAQYPGETIWDNSRAFFNVGSSAQEPAGTGVVRYGEIVVPEDPFPNILSPHRGSKLYFHTLTINGDLAGHIHPSVVAGTPSENVGHILHTNLSTL